VLEDLADCDTVSGAGDEVMKTDEQRIQEDDGEEQKMEDRKLFRNNR